MSESLIILGQSLPKLIESWQVGWVDIVFVVISIWALIVGYRGGLGREFAKVVSVIAGLFVTFQYMESLSLWAKRNSFLPQEVVIPLAYVLMLVVSILILFYVLQVVGKIIEVKVALLLDKIGGMLAAVARYILIMGLATHFLLFFQVKFIEDSFKTHSMAGPYLVTICSDVQSVLSKWIPLPEWVIEPEITTAEEK